MNPEAYLEMAETESRHWWFRGRRAIISDAIAALRLPRGATILEVGCGTGGNLVMLSNFGSVCAMEMDSSARSLAETKTKGIFRIEAGCCPDDIPFTDESFDLICMFDVLEHVEQDKETLLALKGLLKSDGRLLLTVPAYRWLWGAHDEFLHHKRRYTRAELRGRVLEVGLSPLRISYFNTLLFPLIAMGRLWDKLRGGSSVSGKKVPAPLLNSLLEWVFRLEKSILRFVNLPYGASLICVVGRAREQGSENGASVRID